MIRRLICAIRGHVNAATMLPEEDFGLYAYSRLYCSRCNKTFAKTDVDPERYRWHVVSGHDQRFPECASGVCRGSAPVPANP